MTGGDELPRVGVWWDLNTCPLPRGFDPRSVRRSIESAFRKMLDEPCRVTICVVGNLDYVSRRLLRSISCAGIHVTHSVFGGLDLFWLLKEWSKHTPPPAKIMLISSNPKWFCPFVVPSGYTVLRAFPDNHRPSLQPYAFYAPGPEERDWETLLKENSYEFVENTSLKYEPAWSCFLCTIDSFGSCDSFVNHLQSAEHRQELFDSVDLDKNDVPVRYCSLCKYPGYDDFNMDVHYNSAEHKRRVSIEKNKVLGHRFSRMDLISSMISNPESERLGLASFSEAAFPITESKSSDASHP